MSALSQVYPDRVRGGGNGQRRLSACRQTLAALSVSAAAGLAIFATAAGSLMRGASAAPSGAESPPPGWIDLAFADVDAASAHPAMRPLQTQAAPPQNLRQQETRKQAPPCADFVYYFLNTNCSVKRVSSARRYGFAHRAVAARTAPVRTSGDMARNPDRVTFAATTITATD